MSICCLVVLIGALPSGAAEGSIDPECLYFENAQGRIAWTREMGIREKWLTRWITLPSRGKQTVNLTLRATALKAWNRPDPFPPADQTLCLESGGV